MWLFALFLRMFSDNRSMFARRTCLFALIFGIFSDDCVAFARYLLSVQSRLPSSAKIMTVENCLW